MYCWSLLSRVWVEGSRGYLGESVIKGGASGQDGATDQITMMDDSGPNR